MPRKPPGETSDGDRQTRSQLVQRYPSEVVFEVWRVCFSKNPADAAPTWARDSNDRTAVRGLRVNADESAVPTQPAMEPQSNIVWDRRMTLGAPSRRGSRAYPDDCPSLIQCILQAGEHDMVEQNWRAVPQEAAKGKQVLARFMRLVPDLANCGCKFCWQVFSGQLELVRVWYFPSHSLTISQGVKNDKPSPEAIDEA